MADRFQDKVVAVMVTAIVVWLAWSAVLYVIDQVNIDGNAHHPSEWQRR